jgi:glutamate dehydrogenase
MNQTQEIRAQTLAIVQAQYAQNNPSVSTVLEAWLTSLEEDDLSGILPTSLASVLWEGFTNCADWTPVQGCKIDTLAYQDGRGNRATGLLIFNPDMPYLVDTIVMALRHQRVVARAVLNVVLAVHRDANGKVLQVGKAKAFKDSKVSLESIVFCLLDEQLKEAETNQLLEHLTMSIADAATVHHDAHAISETMLEMAEVVEACANDGLEAAEFLRWADKIGFETFGYVYFAVQPESKVKKMELKRDVSSALGVLKNKSHPVYGDCLRSIPGDYDTLNNREDTLSIVKADVQATLYRDQQLDFIGVRNIDSQGVLLGEHCLVGLFSRAATATALTDIPFARVRISNVLRFAGVRPEGFRSEKFVEILESFPRVEVLEAQLEWLASVSSVAVALYKLPRVKVFARRDVYGRHLNVLLFMPRELYSSKLTATLADALREAVEASEVQVDTLVTDGPLARVYLIAKGARPNLDMEAEIRLPLLAVLEGWHSTFNRLVDELDDAELRVGLRRLCNGLSAEYIAVTAPVTAFHDLCGVLKYANLDRMKVRIETTQPASIRLQSVSKVPALSYMLPAIQNAGIVIERERAYKIERSLELSSSTSGTPITYITCLFLDDVSAEKLAQPGVVKVAEELFESLLNNEREDGRLNALVVAAKMSSKEVQVIRAYSSYWRQVGCRFSLRYMADCLKKQASYVRQITDAFLLRFNPELNQQQRDVGTAALEALKEKLVEINHVDTETILRTIVELVLATLRTSYFQTKQLEDTILFKFDTTQLAWLPQPRPFREIFVFSRRFEGVHLRGGPVARGGLRWSDRMEDYRTEVLGLVKAQIVKNAVIVPAGAKGGFVCKMIHKGNSVISDREMIAMEGEAVYRLFIGGLLDLTDNRVQGEIVHPEQTVCYDDADPYLVVAADKGTATFSDIANSIAVERGFWLGDAFASGGSNGYDHKKLGITAKGAWEAVKRHFYELGHNWTTTPITMTGVGDMSGDVFGNGLLLSHQVKLIAAFDHRHIFIDPTPDVNISFEERTRLFGLSRSSWDDYNKILISAGGAVYPRDARSITLSLQAQEALSTDAKTVTPDELMHIILMAKVDLFYNGGIGTYIKASTETHEQVKDRANDAIRVDGNAMRCKVVAEGGNLGATQAGRIEFALQGGRIFTDAIDNSAGVDCSDHEVNVKIWLDSEAKAGKITTVERNSMLTQMTSDIVQLVLRDNTQQTRLLVREEQTQQHETMRDAYANLMRNLEAEGVLSRKLEQLPSELELIHRKESEGLVGGLTAPELAVVIANVKNRYKGKLSALPLTEHSWAKQMLTPYFPGVLVATRNSLDHPLANPILGTVLANEAVNRCGPIMLVELAAKYSVEETDVILAWSQAWTVLNLAPIFSLLDEHAMTEPCEVSMKLDERCRVLQRAVIEGVLSVPQIETLPELADNVAELAALFSQPEKVAPLFKTVTETKPYARASQMVEALIDMADFLFSTLTMQRKKEMDLAVFLQIGLQLRQQSGIAQLEPVLMQTHVTPLRTHALNALRRAQHRLLELVLVKMPAIATSPVLETEQLVQHINTVLTQMGLEVKTMEKTETEVEPPSLESAVLDVWSLSEAASAVGV